MLTQQSRLDALVNNAAVVGMGQSPAEGMVSCFQTNATGPFLMVENFAPLLKKAHGTPRIVNVSTSQSVIQHRLDPNWQGYDIKGVQYRSSKAALNMVTACQVVEFGPQGFKVFGYCPGFTVSSLGPYNKPESGAQPTGEGAGPIVKILNGERDEEHGKLLHGKGVYPW